MSYYAIDNIDDALETTKDFLWPFTWRTWLKLAVVMFFVGGSGGGGNSGQFNVPSGQTSDLPAAVSTELPSIGELLSGIWPILIAIGAAILTVVLLFKLVGAIMEFVLVESLRNQTVTIRRYWRQNWRRGIRLFLFRLLLTVGGLAILGTLAVIILVPVFFNTLSVSLLLLVALVPVFLLTVIFLVLVHGFTTMFVVPIMLLEERGVLGAWSRFWPTLRGQWKQYLVYALLNAVLSIAAGIVTLIGTLLAVVILLIPFGLLGVMTFFLYGAVEVAGLVVAAILGLLFVIMLFALVLLIRVPVVTYLRYYGLLVLGDTNDDLDLIPDQRTSVRDESGSNGVSDPSSG